MLLLLFKIVFFKALYYLGQCGPWLQCGLAETCFPVSRREDRYGAAHFNWVTVHQFTHWLEHCRYQAPGNLEIACLAELSKSALWEMTYRRQGEDIFTLVSKCAHQSKLSCAVVHLQNYEYRSTNEISTTDVVSWKIQINYSLLRSSQIDFYCHVCYLRLCQNCIVLYINCIHRIIFRG